MKNDIFDIKFTDGGVSSIVINADNAKMEWVKPGRGFGTPSDKRNARYFVGSDFKLVSFAENENKAIAEFRVNSDGWQTRKGEFTAKTEYAFDHDFFVCRVVAFGCHGVLPLGVACSVV